MSKKSLGGQINFVCVENFMRIRDVLREKTLRSKYATQYKNLRK
jgi:hypothetical protein